MSDKTNVIILVLSHFEEPYVMLENCIKNTWANHNFDNVKLFFYHGGEKELIYPDKIITNYPEGLDNIGYKTIRTFEILLKNYDFDYVFRTNSSSYINIEKLLTYLENKPRKSFYHGLIGKHLDLNYASGSGYFLSKDLVEKIVENKNFWPHQLIDDLAIAHLLRDLNVYPSEAPRLDIRNTPLPDTINQHFHFRCKTSGDRTGDVIIMNELENKFSEIKKNSKI